MDDQHRPGHAHRQIRAGNDISTPAGVPSSGSRPPFRSPARSGCRRFWGVRATPVPAHWMKGCFQFAWSLLCVTFSAPHGTLYLTPPDYGDAAKPLHLRAMTLFFLSDSVCHMFGACSLATLGVGLLLKVWLAWRQIRHVSASPCRAFALPDSSEPARPPESG